VRGGREIEEEVGRVLRSLHSREKRDVRTRVLQALIACTRERERERESLAPRSWGVAERGVSEGRERLSG
jgi:hypothetical protein